MVAGKWLMQGRKVRTIDTDKTLSDALQIARKFKAKIVEIDKLAQD
jgi:hypothetical protein